MFINVAFISSKQEFILYNSSMTPRLCWRRSKLSLLFSWSWKKKNFRDETNNQRRKLFFSLKEQSVLNQRLSHSSINYSLIFIHWKWYWIDMSINLHVTYHIGRRTRASNGSISPFNFRLNCHILSHQWAIIPKNELIFYGFVHQTYGWEFTYVKCTSLRFFQGFFCFL